MKRARMSLFYVVALGLLALYGPAWAIDVNDPISHWKFDEGSGTVAYDSAGDNDGTIYGATWTTGQINGALSFDGVDDYVDVPYDHSLNVTANGDPDFAVEAWINVALFPSGTAGDTARYILYRGVQPSKYQFALDIYKDTNYFNIISFAIGAPGGGGTGTISPTLQVNRWYHVVGTYDGYNIFLYLNGEEVYWNYRNYTSQGVWEGSAPLYIGTKVNEEFFNGIIDEVAIYNRALSAEEIEQLYQDGLVQLVGLEITGLKEVAENFEAQYTAIAYYDNNSTEDVTDLALWLVGPEEIASIESGLLRTEEIDEPQDITIYAQYTEGDITVEAEKAVSVFAICPTGTALSFDGVDDYVDVGDPADGSLDFEAGDSFTITAWIKCSDTQVIQQVVNKRRGGGLGGVWYEGYLFRVNDDNISLGIEDTSSNRSAVQGGTVVTDNQWHFVAGVRDTSTEKLYLYVDGSSDATPVTDTTTGTLSGPKSFEIGHSLATVGDGHWYFDGIIDDVRVYDRALSAEEIQVTMHRRLTADEPNLIGYWDFDEGEGQIAYDLSPNDNNGQLGSTPIADDSDPAWVDSDAPIGICIPASIDIKPQSCPNPLNVNSKGVLPVAILGSEDLDVTTIDVASILLAGVDSIRSNYEDVAAPVSNGEECECTTEGPDGYLDLTLKFETRQVVDALGEVTDGDVLPLTLTGMLFDETAIEGVDCIVVVGKFKPFNKADINKDGVVNILDFDILAENWLQSSIVED
ncbi:MAG: hypothetical protein AMJ43_06965 [Coxiella sp. DG_40]|nr:MAG: hypothetical protein AMJ43_06965 [Coxiella sp. DG_40]